MPRMLWLACALVIWNSSIVQADIILQFSDTSGQAKNDFEISSIGGTVDVSIFLIETNPSNLIQSEGLFSAAFRLDYSTLGVGAATVADTSNVSFDPIFDLTAPAVTLSSNSVVLDLATSDLAYGIGLNQFKLATVRFTGVTAGALQLKLADISGDNFLTQNLTSFDNSINFSSTSTLTITAAPEPTWLLSILGPPLGYLLHRRHRRTQCDSPMST